MFYSRQVKFRVWSITEVLLGWYFGTLKAPINNYFKSLSFESELNAESNVKICLDPFTELPWNLISLFNTTPSNKSFTVGPSGYLPIHKLNWYLFLTSKYKKYLVLCCSHNYSICSRKSKLIILYSFCQVYIIFWREAKVQKYLT